MKKFNEENITDNPKIRKLDVQLEQGRNTPVNNTLCKTCIGKEINILQSIKNLLDCEIFNSSKIQTLLPRIWTNTSPTQNSTEYVSELNQFHSPHKIENITNFAGVTKYYR